MNVHSRPRVQVCVRRMIVRGLVMNRSGARRGLVLAGVAGLGLVIAFAPASWAQMQATPAPVDCGVPITAWGGAIADDVSVDLLKVERTGPRSSSTPVATPESLVPGFFAELLVENLG